MKRFCLHAGLVLLALVCLAACALGAVLAPFMDEPCSNPSTMLNPLCPVCAAKDRAAFNRLIFRVRGEHQCPQCGRTFNITFKSCPPDNKS
jgi:hypothetical protein